MQFRINMMVIHFYILNTVYYVKQATRIYISKNNNLSLLKIIHIFLVIWQTKTSIYWKI